MSRPQFGFLIGFLFAWLLWAASFWVAIGAMFAGVIGYLGVRVIEGDLDLGEMRERVSGTSRRS
jgi:hypothetical protein